MTENEKETFLPLTQGVEAVVKKIVIELECHGEARAIRVTPEGDINYRDMMFVAATLLSEIHRYIAVEGRPEASTIFAALDALSTLAESTTVTARRFARNTSAQNKGDV